MPRLIQLHRIVGVRFLKYRSEPLFRRRQGFLIRRNGGYQETEKTTKVDVTRTIELAVRAIGARFYR